MTYEELRGLALRHGNFDSEAPYALTEVMESLRKRRMPITYAVAEAMAAYIEEQRAAHNT